MRLDEMLLANVADDGQEATDTIVAIADQFEKMMLACLILSQREDPTRDFLSIYDDRDMEDGKGGRAYRVRLAIQITPITGTPAGEAKH